MPPFESIKSTSLRIFNFGFTALLFALFLLLICGLFSFLFEKDFKLAIAIFVLSLISIIVIVIIAIENWKKVYTTIIIDEEGIKYFNIFNDRFIKIVLWKDLAKKRVSNLNLENEAYDITAVFPYRSNYARFYWYRLEDKNVVLQTEMFHGNHVLYLLYSNRLKLIRNFLLGVRHFRPDLKLDPKMFTDHFIDPENFDIDSKQRHLLFFYTLLFVIVIAAMLFIII